MLSTAVISLMYCSIQTRKRGLTADRENNMWRYLDGVSAPPLYMILSHNDTVLIVEVFEVLSLDENPTRSEVQDYNCLFVLNGVRMFLCC